MAKYIYKDDKIVVSNGLYEDIVVHIAIASNDRRVVSFYEKQLEEVLEKCRDDMRDLL